MRNAIHKLEDFIPKKANSTLIDTEDEDLFQSINYDVYEIYEEGQEDLFGVFVFNEKDKLINIHLFDMNEKGSVMSKDVATISNDFIRAFYPEQHDVYVLESVVDLADEYMVSYGLKDEKYGLIIPHVGFIVSVSMTGQVVQLNFDDTPYEIVYPEKISAEATKEHYLPKLDFELISCELDKKIYANGDGTYRLVYRVLESAIDILATGGKGMTVLESSETEAFQHQIAPNKTCMK